MVIELQVAPHAELLAGFEYGVFNLVLIVLVGDFQAPQLLRDGDALVGFEGEARHGVQQDALGFAEVVAVEHEHLACIAVLGPQVLGIRHTLDEVGYAFAFLLRRVVDEHHVEQQAVDFEIFESPQHFFREARMVHGIDFHEEN